MEEIIKNLLQQINSSYYTYQEDDNIIKNNCDDSSLYIADLVEILDELDLLNIKYSITENDDIVLH